MINMITGIATSKIGLIAITIALMSSWNYIDKRNAVKEAANNQADLFLIESQHAQIAELNRRIKTAEDALTEFEDQLALDRENEQNEQKELEDYEHETDSDFVIGDELIEWLHNR